MTSYERIKSALYFQTPDRLPVEFPGCGHSDFSVVGWNQIGTGNHEQHHTLDEWGCTWSRSDVKNMGLVTGHPLVDLDGLDTYCWPDPDDEKLYEGMEARFAGHEDQYILTSIFALLFERMHHLHGFENTLMDLLLEPDKMAFLADRIVDFDIRVIRNISRRFPGRIHGFTFTDDWGTENAAFINKELFDEFFAPRYKKIFDVCHEVGWDVWMHSCGKINELIPSLIESGVNALNMLQPNTNGIEEIGRRFSGKVCFYTCCDIQTTLVNGTDAEIEQEAKKLMNTWGTEKGGFIFANYGSPTAIGSTIERSRIMYDAFLKHDRWKAAAGSAGRVSP